MKNTGATDTPAILESEYGQGVTKHQAYLSFIIVSLALLMAAIDGSIVSVAFPALLKDLNTSLASTAWVITGYMFTQAVLMPIIGKLSDEWGRKRIFIIAVVLFTLSSVAAALSPNIIFLIVMRVIQGIGGGAFMPSATGIIADAFGKKRATAIGLFGAIFPIGGIIGPNIGGLIIDHLSWRWIFFVNVPIGILLLVSGILILPRGSLSNIKRSIDFIGAGIFSAAMLSILFGMTVWADNSSGPPFWIWPLFVLGVGLFLYFGYYEGKIKQPAIELMLLKEKAFVAANLFNFVFGSIVFGVFSFIPYYAVIGYNMTAVESGLVLTPRSIVAIIVTSVTSLLIIRFRYRLPMIVGSLAMAAGLIIIAQGYHDVTILGMPVSNLAFLAGIVALGGLGMGIANPAANNAILDLHPDKAAAVTGMRGTFRISGGLFGTTLIALWLSHYQDKAVGLEHVLLIFAGLLVLCIPLTFLIPDMVTRKPSDKESIGPE
jgi:EmrB/QacA subfamily drug resistance transporter